jgi:mannitol-specific phosphotransferase system IIBC component
MKSIAIILIVIGILGLLLSTMMFGDIGVAAAIGSLTAIFSGVGFLQVNKRL